jgi:hypothetical protein
MYKNASRNIQRRTDRGRKPRRGLRSSFPGGTFARSQKMSDTKWLDNLQSNEAKARLREAPIASAPVPGEGAADSKRLQEIRLRQKKEKKRIQEKIQARSKARKSRKRSRKSGPKGYLGRFF